MTRSVPAKGRPRQVAPPAVKKAWSAHGNYGLGNGLQTKLIGQLPIEVTGNSIGVAGITKAASGGGSAAQVGADCGCDEATYAPATEHSTEAGHATEAASHGWKTW